MKKISIWSVTKFTSIISNVTLVGDDKEVGFSFNYFSPPSMASGIYTILFSSDNMIHSQSSCGLLRWSLANFRHVLVEVEGPLEHYSSPSD